MLGSGVENVEVCIWTWTLNQWFPKPSTHWIARRISPIESSCVGAFHGFPSLAWLICLDPASISAVVSTVDILLRASKTPLKAAEKHFTQFLLGLFVILCSGLLGHYTLVKLYYLLSFITTCSLYWQFSLYASYHFFRAGHWLITWTENPMIWCSFTGSETTFFFLSPGFQETE